MFNPNWPVWIYSSASQHFIDIVESHGLQMYCEGEDRHTDNLTEYTEFRMNGPFITEPSKDAYVLTCDVSMLVSVKKNGQNIYRPHQIAGWLIAACFDVCVYDRGREIGVVPYTEQFNLTVKPDSRVMWQFLGQVESNTHLIQGVVTAKYEVKLP